MLKRIAYILLVFLLPSVAAGQGILEGVVSDRVSGGRLEFVNIGLIGTSTGTATDAGGHYQLKINSADSITIRFSFTGYEPQEYRLRVNGTRRLDVRLSPSTRVLQQVEVSDEKSRQTAFEHINVQQLDKTVGPSGGVESLLKTLPDVSSNNEMSSQYSVRGGSFDENLVYINGIEIFRPVLIRSAQQEGMSIINPDLVDYILFSPGGFDASYGDKMSSALDITYGRPQEFSARLSASLLGASASVMGRAGEKWSYATAFRRHSNNYILSSLDTKGSYTTHYTDLQAVADYRPNPSTNVNIIGMWTHNVYGLIPESQITSFGGFSQYMQLQVYFDGQERDQYNTLLGAVSVDFRPNDDWKLRASLSAQRIVESERYDIQDQYFLYEVGLGGTVGETELFDRGVGTFLEHASNRLLTSIVAAEFRASRYARLGQWEFGAKVQYDDVSDHLREWRWVDSAGYAIPSTQVTPGDSTNMPTNPLLQRYANAENSLATLHTTFFAQRELNFTIHDKADIKVLAGLRGHWYCYEVDASSSGLYGTPNNSSFLLSPRVSLSCKPYWQEDILFRLAAGVYSQPPFYRELRRDDGTLDIDAEAQKSYQVMGTADWNLRLWGKLFKLTADIYYKYITDLIPYTLDNLRLRYQPDLDAVGYTAGTSLRLNGEFVKGLESWASLSLMRAREDIEGDGLGWLPRPTDQLLSFKVFLQDNIPQMPWWKMSLSFIVGSRIPIDVPGQARTAEPLRIPPYFRVDWGNTLNLKSFDRIDRWGLLRNVKDVQIGLEVFNLFNYRNTISYLWVYDYEGRPFRVPNYLTARQINVKLTILL